MNTKYLYHIISKYSAFLSECTTNSDCTEDNRKTCTDNVCVCDSVAR